MTEQIKLDSVARLMGEYFTTDDSSDLATQIHSLYKEAGWKSSEATTRTIRETQAAIDQGVLLELLRILEA